MARKDLEVASNSVRSYRYQKGDYALVIPAKGKSKFRFYLWAKTCLNETIEGIGIKPLV
jgi:hypothetical protein